MWRSSSVRSPTRVLAGEPPDRSRHGCLALSAACFARACRGIDALEQALYGRLSANSLIRHSDRSSQYLLIKYTERQADAGLEPHAGTVGDSHNNALAVTIIGLFKAM